MAPAIATSPDYTVVELPMNRLFHDESFNCRGQISPLDVSDLAKDIENQQLQFPITVHEGPFQDQGPETLNGFDFRIIAGHRRHKAFKLLQRETIPCMIKRGLTESRARILNLSENFQRKDLNLLQEARALESLEKAGIPRDHVAKELGKSSSWVQVRYYVLRLPTLIQEEAAAGILNQYQIKALYTLDTEEAQFEAVRQIKEAKLKGEKPAEVKKAKSQKLDLKRERKRAEIFSMIEILAKNVGYGLHTRALAWASGEISTDELFADIKRENPSAILREFVSQ